MTETIAKEAKERREQVVLWKWADSFFVRDVDSAMLLHSPEYHMATMLPMGTVQSHAQQNKYLTLPIMIPRCAARHLLAEGQARLNKPLSRRAMAAFMNERYSGDVVFTELCKRGFWLTDGVKFGAQWMCYRGDPLVFHATCAVLIASSTLLRARQERPDKPTTAAELVAFARICNTTKKTAVVADETEEKAHFVTISWVPDM